jgi:hypothetical protein
METHLRSGGLELIPQSPGRSDRSSGQVGDAPGMARFALRRNSRTHEGKNREARIYVRWNGPEKRAKGQRPDINEDVKINLAPGERLGMFPVKKIVGTVEGDGV